MSYRKKYIEGFVWGTSIFSTGKPPLYVIFVAFFVYSPSQVTYLLNDPKKDTYYYSWYSVWYRKYVNLLEFNTSWLASLRTWYYFRLFLASVALAIWPYINYKEVHINCYLFFTKVLIKNKNLQTRLRLLVAQFTAKTTNAEKAIYFLSIMSCSTNKLKSHRLFTCKSCMFSNLAQKLFFLLQKMVGEGGLTPTCTLFLYGPVYILTILTCPLEIYVVRLHNLISINIFFTIFFII